jgi:hypothetical protein
MPELVNMRILMDGGFKKEEIISLQMLRRTRILAMIYLRGIGLLGEWRSSLLIAPKVAPFKLKSILRPLCGALLVACLLQKLANALYFDRDVLYAWSDDRLVLTWIYPFKWTIFIANQVPAIQYLRS